MHRSKKKGLLDHLVGATKMEAGQIRPSALADCCTIRVPLQRKLAG